MDVLRGISEGVLLALIILVVLFISTPKGCPL